MAFKKEIIEIIEPRDVFVGPDTAPVTLMEFGEYENEDCAKAHEVVKKIMEEFKGKVRFNFRHFPLNQNSPAQPEGRRSGCCGCPGR